jgi:hypothetical protein
MKIGSPLLFLGVAQAVPTRVGIRQTVQWLGVGAI